jgi:hypothetical protein
MNYTQLVQSIQDYTQNEETSFVSNIPNFVQQAEERINRSIMLPELRKNATASTTADNKYLARPTDFLAVFSLAVIDGDAETTHIFLIKMLTLFVKHTHQQVQLVSHYTIANLMVILQVQKEISF